MAKRKFNDEIPGNEARLPHRYRRFLMLLTLCVLVATAVALRITRATHETNNGEIEGRPSPTFRRICLGGGNAGKLCKQNSECPGSTCRDRNVFNITVAVLYNAPASDITAIRNMITAASATIFDATDGQAEIGSATIHNNAISSNKADLVIHPATNPVWWQAQTGHFRTGGFMEVSIDNVLAAASPGPILGHEFSHLVFDPRDEYESRAAGCGAVNGSADCPVPAAGDGTCLMDGNGTEYCWGQGNSGNLTDLSNGNHDPTNVTEQSRCRTNRSCWDQIVWSWPTTFLKPTSSPDPNVPGGATVNPTNFIVTNDNVRVVLVLDESGSMSLESPSRIARLKVAAGDFIATAENGTELGLVSFATDAETASGRANVAIAALGANRSAWTNEVTGLAPATRTNIGAGLQKARDQITAAGGVTANTYVVLMTDGVNNEPGTPANAAADLQAKINDFMAAGIPVFVTCTGGDLGLQSQCSEIAAGTSGFYSDSADASRMPQAFVDFHERITGHQGTASFTGSLSKMREAPPLTLYVDEFSESASFSLLWTNANASARAVLTDPLGNNHQMQPIPQGLYARIPKPAVGEWKMKIDPTGGDSPFTAKGYVLNRVNNLIGTTRWAKREPGAEMYIYGFPQSRGGAVTEPGAKLVATISRPDGSTETLDLFDEGRDSTGHGDDVAGDGVFTGVYKNTSLKGAYGFQISGAIDKWHQGNDAHKRDERAVSPKFVRELRISTAVGQTGDTPKEPEDDRPGGQPGGPGGPGGFERYCRWLFVITFILLLIALFLLWRCKRRRP
jgi:hypothetical protein